MSHPDSLWWRWTSYSVHLLKRYGIPFREGNTSHFSCHFLFSCSHFLLLTKWQFFEIHWQHRSRAQPWVKDCKLAMRYAIWWMLHLCALRKMVLGEAWTLLCIACGLSYRMIRWPVSFISSFCSSLWFQVYTDIEYLSEKIKENPT